MINKFKILIPLITLILMTGCVQKTKISMKVPGELNAKGIHKIAISDFSTVKSNSELGLYRASNDLLKLAKDKVIDVFYNEPFYSFSNLEIESRIKNKSLKSNIKDRFDGLMYGKLWWQVSPEYKNIIPSKKNLESYTIRNYVCGRTKKGRAIYCSAHLTTKMQEKAFNIHYRVKNATLMMSLNLYKVSSDGKLSKVTEVFEVAKGKFQIQNGQYKQLISLIGDVENMNKIKSLSKKEDKGFFGKLLGNNSKVSTKVNSDIKISNNINTIPSKFTMSSLLVEKISKKLKTMIAPSLVDFELEIEKGDKKVEKMFDYSAFNSIASYIVEQKLALGNINFYEGYYDVDFMENTKKLISFIDKKEFDLENKKAKEKKQYTPIKSEELEEKATTHLKTNAPLIYNYALATEAIGNFEKSLEIYRYLFNTIDDKNQLYANGIGRSLLALDMGDKVSEETLNKIKAKKKNSL